LNIPKDFYIEPFYYISEGEKGVEETLYNIEIHKDETGYLGRIFSDMDGVKEFKNNHLDQLLRDITIDMQLALEEFSNRSTEFVEAQESHARI
jgi:hypothetical protein